MAEPLFYGVSLAMGETGSPTSKLMSRLAFVLLASSGLIVFGVWGGSGTPGSKPTLSPSCALLSSITIPRNKSNLPAATISAPITAESSLGFDGTFFVFLLAMWKPHAFSNAPHPYRSGHANPLSPTSVDKWVRSTLHRRGVLSKRIGGTPRKFVHPTMPLTEIASTI